MRLFTRIRPLSFIFPLLLLFVWWLLVRFGLLPPSQAVGPLSLLSHTYHLFVDGTIARQLLISLFRLVIGLIVGGLFGVVFALITTQSRCARQVFAPTLTFLGAIPVIVWIPFWTMFFGIGESLKIGLVALACYFFVYASCATVFEDSQSKHIDLAKLFELSVMERVWHILLPPAVPAIFTALRIGVALGWIVLFFVEYASAFEGEEGLGWFVANARAVGRRESEFAGLLLIGLAGVALDRTLKFASDHLTQWVDSDRARR